MPSNTILDTAGDQYLEVDTARWARPLPADILTGWTGIRIGFRMLMGDSGANLTGTPLLAFGLCSGGTDIMGDATTTHFVGGLTADATWTRATSPTRYSFAPFNAMKRVGVTDTIGGDMVASCTLLNQFNRVFYLDITKGSPNYTLSLFYGSSSTSSGVSTAVFQQEFRASVPAISTPAHTQGAGVTVAVDEGVDGTLDHLCFSWDKSTVMSIYDMQVRRIGL